MVKRLIRKAEVKDVKRIKELIDYYAKEDRVLPRSLNELYENVRDFWVYEESGKVYGCSALHISWEDLAEVKSLVVEKTKKGEGIGKELLQAAISEAKELNIKRVFALTYERDFFKRYGFKEVDKSELPHKIWGECIHCVKFPHCDEVALILELS